MELFNIFGITEYLNALLALKNINNLSVYSKNFKYVN